jgi:DNA-binding transcriptional ArsR family regulator
MSTIQFVDLGPTKAVQRAREAMAEGGRSEEILEPLDRHLRWHLLDYLQNRAEEGEEIGKALFGACRWAEQEGLNVWFVRWSYLLELLREADEQPAIARNLRAIGLEGRAAEMLKVLVDHPKPLRPSDLAERMGLSIQQISNLGRRLETAGLIVRQSSGRATWFFPDLQGFELGALLSASASPTQEERETAQGPAFWNLSALDQPVPKVA